MPGKRVNLFLVLTVHSKIPKTVVVLAGGLGSRYKGLKQTDALLASGETLLEFSMYDAIRVGFDKFVLIVNPKISEEFIERLKRIGELKNVEVCFVRQEMNGFVPDEYSNLVHERSKPWGTGHAILTAKSVVKEPFVVINADDFYGQASYLKIMESINENGIKSGQYEMIAFPVASTLSENGSVSRGICTLDKNGDLIQVVEHTQIKRQGSEIISETAAGNVALNENQLVSMNFWCFHPSVFGFLERDFLKFLQGKDVSKSEFFIPTVIQHLISNHQVKVKVHASESQWMGLTYPEDKVILKSFLLNEIEKGNYPSQLW